MRAPRRAGPRAAVIILAWKLLQIAQEINSNQLIMLGILVAACYGRNAQGR